MCQVALVGYAVGGAFLSLAYFDLPYDILIIAVLAKRWALEAKSEQKNAADAPLDGVSPGEAKVGSQQLSFRR